MLIHIYTHMLVYMLNCSSVSTSTCSSTPAGVGALCTLVKLYWRESRIEGWQPKHTNSQNFHPHKHLVCLIWLDDSFPYNKFTMETVIANIGFINTKVGASQQHKVAPRQSNTLYIITWGMCPKWYGRNMLHICGPCDQSWCANLWFARGPHCWQAWPYKPTTYHTHL